MIDHNHTTHDEKAATRPRSCPRCNQILDSNIAWSMAFHPANKSEKGQTLTAENIAVDMLIENKDNPDWGNFRVLSKYDDRIWDIRNRAGDTTLFQSEFHFWRVVKYVR